jgi:hypothetical protein
MSSNELASNFHNKIKLLADQFQIPVFYLTMTYACLYKLYRSALRMTSLKQEVLTKAKKKIYFTSFLK